MKKITFLILYGVGFLGLLSCPFIINYFYSAYYYKQLQNFVEKGDWKQAHSTLSLLSPRSLNFKDTRFLISKVDFNYYVLLGDQAYKDSNFSAALSFYNKAKTDFNDEFVEEKINSTTERLFDYYLSFGDEAYHENDFAKALDYYNKAKIGFNDELIAEKINNTNDSIEKQKQKENKEREIKIKNLKNKMRIEHDKVENITWYYDKTTPYYSNRNKNALYIGEKNGNCWIRWKLTYAGDDWIFFDKIIFNIDGNRFERNFDHWETTREVVHGGGVYESVDVAFDKNKGLVKDIIDSKETIVRFKGEYIYDKVVTTAQKQAMQRMIDLCNLINEQNR